MFRSLGVPVKGATALCGDKLVMITYFTNLDLDIKSKHVAISYHKLREITEAGVFNPLKVCTAVNRSGILTKGVSASTLGSFSDALYGDDWGEK